MRAIALCLLAFLLAACEPTEEEKSRAKMLLPQGCTILDLGSYGSARALYVVDCVGRPTRTLNYIVPAGKSSHQLTSVIIDG